MPPWPQGIEPFHLQPRRHARHASAVSLVVLGSLVGFGWSGAAGGGASPRHVQPGSAVALSVEMPAVVRSGAIFETRIVVTARRPAAGFAIGVDPALWRGLTVNDAAPIPASGDFRAGLLRYRYDGALAAGDVFQLRLSQQVNPDRHGINRGRIVVLDGEAVVAGLTLSLKVLP